MTNEELLAKIGAEIERLTDELELQARENAEANNGEATDYCFGVVDMQMNLLSFLDTLESEKPMNLEEEINRYLREECSDDDEPSVSDIAHHFAQWGAEWQKEQMMKDAVEYEVWDFSVEAYPHVNIPLDNKQYRNGDKVRVIVLPKED